MSTYTQLYYHIVFSTKHRRPWLTADLEEHLHPYLGGAIIHRDFPQLADFAWQEGYAALTVSASQKDRVRQYIQDQKTHHLEFSCKEELIAFLVAHEIDFDEKYLWD